MKKLIFSIIVLIIALLFYQCKDQLILPENKKHVEPISPAEQKIASSSDLFGLKLFKQINNAEGDKNIFISPLSVSMALGMTLNGAHGSTYDSMKAVLELNNLIDKEINEAYKNLIYLLTNLDSKVVFNIANSIWYKNDYQLKQDFITINKNYFNAEVSGLDFSNPSSVDIINNWVSQNTDGKITQILNSIPGEMVMYLINAIYFKGDWKYQFNKEYTKDDFFTTTDGSKVSCRMMEQENDFNYLSNDLFQAVDIPYGDSSFSMIIFLPGIDQNINDLVNQFNEINWTSWLSSFNEKEGNLLFPKFELKYDIKLNDVLAAMGMQIAFSDFADFSNMNSSGGLCISEVLHKTYVKVDEEGTEAAAVTSVGFETTSIGGPKFYMRVDRPFLFAIKDNYSNSILFIGKVINPVQ